MVESDFEKKMIGDILTSDESQRNLEALCEFGSRWGGTEGEEKAVEYMINKFREYDLENPHREPFEYKSWTRGSTSLDVTAPKEMELPCISLPYSPSTPPGGVEGELVSVGDGTPQEFELAKDNIPGNIVMISSRTPPYFNRWMHRCEKLGRAIRMGAKAFIFMNHYGGLGEVTGGARLGSFEELGTPCDIPAIGISKETGSTLKRVMRNDTVKVRIKAEHVIKDNTSWNVVAEIKGNELPEKEIIVGAHFDGHDISVGAMDDAAGTCVVMETARAMAKKEGGYRRTIKFIAFPLEEPGLFGSIAYAKDHEDEMENIDFMINLDGAGRAQRPGIMLQGFNELVPFFKKLSSEMKFPFPVAENLGLYSDYLPFFIMGVPSSNLSSGDRFQQGRTGRGFGHTRWDTVDKVDMRDMQEAAVAVARIIAKLADMEGDIFKHKTREKVKQILQEKGYDEILKIEQRYPSFL
jgi:Zn-dependent M28 family amino/carboxypeptidase